MYSKKQCLYWIRVKYARKIENNITSLEEMTNAIDLYDWAVDTRMKRFRLNDISINFFLANLLIRQAEDKY